MEKPEVLVTWPIPDEALALLRSRCHVKVNHNPWTKERLLAEVKGYDALLVVSGTPIDHAVCEVLKERCKIIAGHGVGYNHIDLAAATACGIPVTNTPGAVTDATADLAFTLLCATARRIVECDRFVRSGARGWGPTNMLGSQISGKTLGIIGAGRIGTAVARRSQGFDMKIIYVNPEPNPILDEMGAVRVEKSELIQQADFISIHTPLLESTRHYIGADELSQMKSSAILINCSRGPVVDEQALVAALQAGQIAGAGLDVFEKEPSLTAGLEKLENVIMTPHIGTSTLDTRIEMGEMCAKAIFAVLDGKAPANCLNPEVLG